MFSEGNEDKKYILLRQKGIFFKLIQILGKIKQILTNKVQTQQGIRTVWPREVALKDRTQMIYCTCAIITRGLYTFYPLFEVDLYTVTFGIMYG